MGDVRPAALPLVQVLAKVALAIAIREAAAEGTAAPTSSEPTPIARRRRRRPAA